VVSAVHWMQIQDAQRRLAFRGTDVPAKSRTGE